MRSLSFFVPGVPVAKGRPRLTTIHGQARAFTPAKTVNYEGLVAKCGSDAMDGAALFDGPVSVTIRAYFPIAPSWSKKKREAAVAGLLRHTSRPDWDNVGKAISDGLNGVVWIDDSQIAIAGVIKRYRDTPGVDVEVRAL